LSSSAIKFVSFWCDNDLDCFLFFKLSCVSFISLLFEIERFSRYWLKVSKIILFFLFSLKTIFWYFRTFSIIATTFHKLSISLTRKHSRTKSIANDSKQKRFFRFFLFFRSRLFRCKIRLMTKNSNCSFHKDSKHRFL
jgi:hypothetical protein